MRLLLSLTFSSSIILSPAFADDNNIINNHFRATYEEVAIANKETMGFLGSSFLFDKQLNPSLSLYSGLGIYSAVTGNRGGFFTGGLEVGGRYKINNQLSVDVGGFVGGGGGASAPQGGGLMLRPHIGLMYDLKNFKIGANYNQVKFPNGNITSNQLGIQLEIPFQMAKNHKLRPRLNASNTDLADVYFALTARSYTPRANVKTRSGKNAQKMRLGGFEVGRYLDHRGFFFAEAGGAYDGEADGYAEFLGGLGYDFPLSPRFTIRTKAALGASGGGDVDTGGGMIYKASIGTDYQILPHLSFGLEYGRINTRKGRFDANILSAFLSYNIGMVVPNKNKTANSHAIGSRQLDLGNWSVATSTSRYLSSNSLRKSNKDNTPVDLINLKLNRELSPRTYFTGQAAAAYKGKSGGYATGLIGMGYKRPLTSKLNFQAEGLIGAGGGGSIASDGGAVIQPMAGLTYQLNKKVDLQVMGGRVRALKGDLNTNVLDVGLVYNFSTLEN